MKSQTWAKCALIIWLAIIFLTGFLVIIVDPYHHYHQPLNCFDYVAADAVYINDGICKNYDYDALITGTSMTSGFSEKEASDLFHMTFLRATFLGEGFKRINENLESAIEHNPNLKFVIRSVDTLWFVSSSDWLAYENYPEYLYNDYLIDDTQYLYNLDMWLDVVIPTLKTFHLPTASSEITFTELEQNQKDYLENEKALLNYNRPPKESESVTSADNNEYFSYMDDNLYKNLLQVVEHNPEIEFYFYFPPYSILWWDSINQAGDGRVNRRIDMEQYAIEKILAYDNVKLFSFFNNFDLICNLDNYSDEIHYHSDINSQILTWMEAGEYELTKENYLSYLSEIRNFYLNYNYNAIFEQQND